MNIGRYLVNVGLVKGLGIGIFYEAGLFIFVGPISFEVTRRMREEWEL